MCTVIYGVHLPLQPDELFVWGGGGVFSADLRVTFRVAIDKITCVELNGKAGDSESSDTSEPHGQPGKDLSGIGSKPGFPILA